MTHHSDLLIIGGGPAGLSAAIVARSDGTSVQVLTPEEYPRDRPGETLHPGIEPLLDRLGVGDEIRAGAYARFPGIRVATPAGERFECYGETDGEPWLGFQIPGQLLDSVLKARGEQLGVEFRTGVKARNIEWDGDGQAVVDDYTAQFVLDCAGGRHWLARRLGIRVVRLSAPLVAQYGYVEMDTSDEDIRPLFAFDETGWLWTARISDTLMHWTRLNLTGELPKREWAPEQWAGLTGPTPPRRVNVTWRRCERVAGPGYFICGEAASVVDPASSHGVLNAIMSGMLAGHYAAQASRDVQIADSAQRSYEAWIFSRMNVDSSELAKRYAKLPWASEWVATYPRTT